MKKYSFISVLLLSFIIISCNDPDPIEVSNIIFEESFERNNMPHFEEWEKNFDDSLLTFAEDVPRDGGKYSIYLTAIWGFPLSITKYINFNPGNYSLELEVWSKIENVDGLIQYGIQSGDSFISIGSVPVNTPQWTSYIKTFNVDIKQGERIKIILSGGSTQLLQGKTYYDKIKLKRL